MQHAKHTKRRSSLGSNLCCGLVAICPLFSTMSNAYDQSHATAIPLPVVGASIDAAILTFVRTIMESETQPHPSQELALNAFATAFQRWNPRTINDIKPADQDIFDLLFTNLSPPTPSSNSSTQNSLGMNVAPRYDHVLEGTMQDYRYKIGTIVQAFNQSLANGTLTIEELLAACIALESSTWSRYATYTNPLQSIAASTATPVLSSATPSTGLFSAAPAFTFAVGSHAPASGGTHIIPYEVTSCQDGRASLNLQSISAMNAYNDRSHEELRFADYSQGNRGSTPWSTRPTGGGLLGSTAPTPAFGAPFNGPTSFGGQPMTPFGTIDNGAVARLTCAGQKTIKSYPNMQPHPLPLLPSINEILYEIDKLEDLKRTVLQYTSVCVKGKLYSLGDYDFHNARFGGGYSRIDVEEKFCTSALQQQLNSIHGTIGTNPDFLYGYIYFKSHPSIFLPSAVAPNQKFDLDFLCKQINGAFGPNMNYAGVGTALELLSTAKDYNAEIKVLLNCKILNISAFDVAVFRAVKFLHKISKPLQDFIQSCALHHFEVVEHDPSFSELQIMANEFYSDESHDRESCLDFFNGLYRILCPGHDSDSTVGVHYLTMLHTIYTLEHARPVDGLEPLKYMLHNSELREYFGDMQWLTIDDEYNADKGLQKFHKDYETVVNILLSYDAMDGLMIVESLEPVVRLFFYLERHHHCQRVHELVLGVKNDQDIQTLLKGTTTLQDDIYDLSARIHSVRDLFQKVCHPPAPPTVHFATILQATEGTVPAPDLVSSNSDSTNL